MGGVSDVYVEQNLMGGVSDAIRHRFRFIWLALGLFSELGQRE
jgi:hypothetical protein